MMMQRDAACLLQCVFVQLQQLQVIVVCLFGGIHFVPLPMAVCVCSGLALGASCSVCRLLCVLLVFACP